MLSNYSYLFPILLGHLYESDTVFISTDLCIFHYLAVIFKGLEDKGLYKQYIKNTGVGMLFYE